MTGLGRERPVVHLGRTGRWPIPADDLASCGDVLQTAIAGDSRRGEASRGFSRLARLMKVDGYEQPGVLVRSREDTLATCGNCSIVCWETPRSVSSCGGCSPAPAWSSG